MSDSEKTTTKSVAVPSYFRLIGKRDDYRLVVEAESAAQARELAKPRWKVIGIERATTHQCSACGAFGAWGPEWSWCGSYRDIDDGNPIQKFCSATCAKSRKPVAVWLRETESAWRSLGAKLREVGLYV